MKHLLIAGAGAHTSNTAAEALPAIKAERDRLRAELDALLKTTTADFARLRAINGELVAALERIKRRAIAHPDDDDADRKRQLYHIEIAATSALDRAKEG